MKNGPKNGNRLRIALQQCPMQLGNVEANLSRLAEAVKAARRDGASLLVGPELGLTGYHLKDAVPDTAISRRSPVWTVLEKLSNGIDLVVGFVEQSSGHQYYNSAAWFSDGTTVHVHRKIYLPTYGMFDEQRYFARGSRVETAATRFGRASVLVCEDVWHPSTVYLASLQGLELLVIPSCSPMRGVTGRSGSRKGGQGRPASAATWEEMNRTYARLYSIGVIYVNRVGVEDGVGFSGGSHVIDPYGEMLLQLPYGEEALGIVDFDLGRLRRSRVQTPVVRDENFELTFSEMERIRRRRWNGGLD